MDGDVFRALGEPQRRGSAAGADAGPFGGTPRPAGERNEKVARAGVGIARCQQAAARHDDQAILDAARSDERRSAAARQGLAPIANLQRVIPTGGEWSEAGVVEGRMRQRCGVEQLRAARPQTPAPPPPPPPPRWRYRRLATRATGS